LRIGLAFTKPISWIAASYIAKQRKHFRQASKQLPASQCSHLQAFFPPAILEKVRVANAAVPSPPFYRSLRKLGLKTIPDLSTIAGITFMDVIVHSERLSDDLLFHELVHVVQYEVLGLKRFAERYVRGFLSTGSYDDIPLERQAYALEARFTKRPKEAFSVLESVTEWNQSRSF